MQSHAASSNNKEGSSGLLSLNPVLFPLAKLQPVGHGLSVCHQWVLGMPNVDPLVSPHKASTARKKVQKPCL